MAYSRTRETAWHKALVREEDYYSSLAELSLIKKIIAY
jgi:hypothetical protein